MITLNHLVRKKNGVTMDVFRDFWLTHHAEQSRNLCSGLGIKKYTKCETLHDNEVNKALQAMYGTDNSSYDFVDQMLINNLEDLRAGLNEVNIQSGLKKLHVESAAFVENSGSDYWFSVDVPQIFPREDINATWEDAYVKVFYVPRRLEKLGLREAQLHWNACHGGMARQFAQLLPYDKYIQGHLEPSALVDQLKYLLGDKFENNDRIIGQAEAWLDPGILPTLQGPEIERMMRMLVQDIDLFVNAKESHIFAAKEYIIFDHPVNGGSIPTLFNAD